MFFFCQNAPSECHNIVIIGIIDAYLFNPNLNFQIFVDAYLPESKPNKFEFPTLTNEWIDQPNWNAWYVIIWKKTTCIGICFIPHLNQGNYLLTTETIQVVVWIESLDKYQFLHRNSNTITFKRWQICFASTGSHDWHKIDQNDIEHLHGKQSINQPIIFVQYAYFGVRTTNLKEKMILNQQVWR